MSKKRILYRCNYPYCKNVWRKDDDDKTNKHFFRFPSDVLRLEAWKMTCKVNEDPVPATFRICQDHFHESEFANKSKSRLKRDAVPIMAPKVSSNKLQNVTCIIIPQS